MAVLTGEARILAANRPFAALFRLTPAQLEGSSLLELARNDPAELQAYLRSASGSGQWIIGQLLLPSSAGAAGEYRAECARLQPAGSGQPAPLLLRLQAKPKAVTQFQILNDQIQALQREIVERRKAQQEILRLNAELEERVRERTAELEESNQELRAFAHTIAHDLRAPLRGMRGFAEILDDEFGTILPPEARDYTRRIAGAADNMHRLLDDLLGYTQVSLMDAVLEPVNWDDVAERTLQLLGSEIVRVHASVDVRYPLGSVRGHGVLMQHALANLLSNALKFAKPGEVPRVRLFGERRDDRLRLSVQDEGIGIPPQYHSRIFKIFERLENTSGAGSGIGLAIVQRGVLRMGGALGVESSPGQGSLFWIELSALQP